ncbi:hypothetical protein OG361_22035 [Streptomyces sp. NBC_00090]|uniref:hypothetical protein n=1 Tax=Streptomyces sp. NBC_00090 TaxID=2903619 RepID=UPI0032469D04
MASPIQHGPDGHTDPATPEQVPRQRDLEPARPTRADPEPAGQAPGPAGPAPGPAPQPVRRDNQLVFSDLTHYPVMAQALDNKWLPTELAEGRQETNAPRKAPGAVAAASAELRRSLVNSGTLVVNRAFFVNNEALYANFVPQAEPADRKAFAQLLNDRAIVPYLLRERDGTEDFAFAHDVVAGRAWRRLITEESDPGLVRLDWDEEANRAVTERMGRRFTRQLPGLKWLNPQELANDLGIPVELATSMGSGILQSILTWAGSQDHTANITRDAVYQEFLTRPGTDPHLGLLRDGAEIVPTKQLIDLMYNVGLPDASGLVALTPPGSPPRRTLQEDVSPRTQDPEAVGLLIRNLVADSLHRAVDGPNSYAGLSLADIITLRETGEWNAYVASLDAFLHDSFRGGRIPDPDEFSERTATIARDHARMLRTARRASRSGQGFAREITTMLVLESGGVALQIASGEEVSLISGTVQMLTAVGGALSVRLEFWDKAARNRRSGLGHSLTLPTLRLGNLKKDWETILAVYGGPVVETGQAPRQGGQADQQARNS